MATQRALDLPGIPVAVRSEPMSAGRKQTERNRALLAAGRHPATLQPLVADGRTCGDCPHAERLTYHDNAYWKCHLHRLGITHSTASDIRISWPACTRIDEPRP